MHAADDDQHMGAVGSPWLDVSDGSTVTIWIERDAERYVIRFSRPVSLYVLAVATVEGEIVWKISPSGMMGNETIKAAVLSVEPALTPDALQRYVEEVRDGNSVSVAPAVEAVSYGVVPDGYKERAAARPLMPATRYHVVAMASGTDATAAFTTEAA